MTTISITLSITLNGEARTEPIGISLADLIASLGYTPQSLATAINQDFVSRDARAARILVHGDAITTFQPITGG